MRSAKAGLCPETYLGSVAQQIYRDVASRYGGEKITSQIRSVAQVLGVKHDLAVRARKGRPRSEGLPEMVGSLPQMGRGTAGDRKSRVARSRPPSGAPGDASWPGQS